METGSARKRLMGGSGLGERNEIFQLSDRVPSFTEQNRSVHLCGNGSTTNQHAFHMRQRARRKEQTYTCSYCRLLLKRRFRRKEGTVMNGYVVNIENETLDNDNFRKVLHTAQHSQLVVMSLLPGEEIGSEMHRLDQFIRVESGECVAILDGEENRLQTDWAVVVPAGTRHNIINTSTTRKLKLYTIYSPPEHAPGTVHRTRAEAVAAEHH